MTSSSRDYAKALEKKLVDQFKQNFYEKLGYHPIVVTKVNRDHDGYMPVMGLEALEEYVRPYYPIINCKRMTIKSKERYREIVEIRMIFCMLARMMHHTCKSIGIFIGGRDHTTVLHNVMQCKNQLEVNDDFKQKYLIILNTILKDYQNESSTLDYATEIFSESESGVPA